MNELTIKLGSKAVKRALFLGVIGMLLMSVTVVTTVTSTNLGSSSVKLGTEAFSNDTDVSIIAKGIKLIKTSAAAAGDSASGVEVTSAMPALNNTLTKNNYLMSLSRRKRQSPTRSRERTSKSRSMVMTEPTPPCSPHFTRNKASWTT